jgi:uncharacterized membrane protein HdeD (DUF308 family)
VRFALARNWWSLVIRGFLGIAVGILAFLWPGITLLALVFLFAGYALVDGVVSLTGAMHAVAAHERWGALLLEGIFGIAVAVITALWPGITALSLVFVIAAWAIITGIAEIAAAIRLRRHVSGEWLLVLGGIASVIFGVLIAVVPLAGALVIAWWFGAYALVFGTILVVLGFRLRTWDRSLGAGAGIPAPAH